MEFNATFIVSAVSFIVFVFIMNAIFYKPLQKIVEDRQKFIDDHYKEATLAHAQSDSLIKEKEQKLDETKHEAKKIIVDKSEDAKKQKAILAAEAQQYAAQVIDGAKDELQKSVENAQEILSENAKTLAQQISSKILG